MTVRIAPLVLLISSFACLELEGRPCSSAADCIDGFRCDASICVKEDRPEEVRRDLVAAALDLLVINPLGDVVVLDNAGDDLVVQTEILSGTPTVELTGEVLVVEGEGEMKLTILLPRRFDLDVQSQTAAVRGRDGAVDIIVDGACSGEDFGGELSVLAEGDASFDLEVEATTDITSTGGDIEITVPSGVRARLDANGNSVDLVGLDLVIGANLFGVAQGSLGSVTATIDLILNAPQGSITITAR